MAFDDLHHAQIDLFKRPSEAESNKGNVYFILKEILHKKKEFAQDMTVFIIFYIIYMFFFSFFTAFPILHIHLPVGAINGCVAVDQQKLLLHCTVKFGS